MIDLDNEVDHNKARAATDLFNQQALKASLAAREHDYVIVWNENGQTYETYFTGSAYERLDYMRALRIDVEFGQWAAGFWDGSSSSWKVCGLAADLRHLITKRPRPRIGARC